MPFHRSTRLFTLGLALAGSCAAQNTQDNKPSQKQARQQPRPARLQTKVDRGERKAPIAKQQKKAEKPVRQTASA